MYICQLSEPGNIKKIAEVLKNLSLKPCDTIVIDAMANSAYFGTDENGLPLPPAKSGEDGRHHMVGDLQLACRRGRRPDQGGKGN
jgi:hypothetical protein